MLGICPSLQHFTLNPRKQVESQATTDNQSNRQFVTIGFHSGSPSNLDGIAELTAAWMSILHVDRDY